MRRLSEPHDDGEDPRESAGGPPGQYRQAPWHDDQDRALRDPFTRLVQRVPEPPPPERNPVLVGAVIGLAVAVAAIAAYVGVTFMTRPAVMVASDTRVEQATADASAAAPTATSAVAQAVAPAPTVAASPSFAAIAPAAAAQVPATPTVREEDSPANLAARIANAAPTATRNVQSMAQGVTDTEIRFGMAAPFSGPAKEMGRQLKLGIETAFAATNDSGGIDGRQLKLVTADDGYEPTRTLNAMKQLYEKDQVFGFVDNYGSPTALVSIPYALEHRAL
jgi:hypothetical protein